MVFLFVSLTGANSIYAPRESTETQKIRPIPRKVNSPNLLNSTEVNSTNEPVEFEMTKKLLFTPKLIKSYDPLASGGTTLKVTPVYETKAHTVLDSLTLPYAPNTGNEWNGRYIYYQSGSNSV